jgi:tetratricopeptide (TPR) repeat protein
MDNHTLSTWVEKILTKQKPLLIGIGILAVLSIGGYYISQIYLPELEVEAQEAMYMAQFNFENRNFDKALNGDGKHKGFNYIKENYSFTKAKKIAVLYAGISNLNLGKFDKAIDDLKGYSTDVPEIQALAYSALGDAYAEKNNMTEAIAYYEKAAKETKNNILAPRLAMKAGKACEVKKDLAKALEMFKLIKTEFPNSQEAGLADIYIAKVENQM